MSFTLLSPCTFIPSKFTIIMADNGPACGYNADDIVHVDCCDM